MANAEQYKGYSLEVDLQADVLQAQQARNAILDDPIHSALVRQAEALERLAAVTEQQAVAQANHQREVLAALRFIGNNV